VSFSLCFASVGQIEEKSDEMAPSFLMVLTASGPRYRREDGVFVTPINKLRD
jgi:hypothetical protein